MKKDAAYYESRYNPRLAVPEFAQHFERWAERSEKARQDAGLATWTCPTAPTRWKNSTSSAPRGRAAAC